MRVYVVRKWPLRERSRFVCNITRVGLWLLCSVRFVQSTQRTRLRDLADLKARIIAAVKNIDAPMLTCVCGKNLNIISMCAVSPVVHTANICSCQKRPLFSFSVAVNNSIKVGPLVFLLWYIFNPLKPELKSHLLFAGIIRSSPFSPR